MTGNNANFLTVAAAPVNIVVAHGLEAKPLIRLLELQAERNQRTYPQYRNAAGTTLIVSGIGRHAMAAATNFLAEQQNDDSNQLRGWLNLGIAGHKTAAIGSAWLANKITERATGSSAYPPQLLPGFKSSTVLTVDEPESDYSEEVVYEMEASAFYAAATKFSTAELVQVFKIISDNTANPINDIDLAMVPAWIFAQGNQILDLVAKLGMLATDFNRSHRIPLAYQDFCSKYHLTVSQKILLKKLCQRYSAMDRESDLLAVSVSGFGSGKQLLRKLTTQLEQAGQL